MDTRKVKTALLILLGVGACTSARPRGEIGPTISAGPADTGAVTASPLMTLVPGLSRYDLEQHAVVRLEGADDTLPHTITTRAVLLVEVLSYNDSSYDVTVSVDSLNQVAEGFGHPSPMQPMTLGPVLRVSFSSGGNAANTQLADSLCEYSQFVTLARQLVLPQLPAQVATAKTGRTPPDIMHITSCRAGVPIRIESTQEVRNLGGIPPQVRIDEKATLQGAGILQRDSITIDGFLTAEGTASFASGSRLPSIVQSSSEGSIRIGLGDSTVTFKQSLTQQLRRRATEVPN